MRSIIILKFNTTIDIKLSKNSLINSFLKIGYKKIGYKKIDNKKRNKIKRFFLLEWIAKFQNSFLTHNLVNS